jgi:hypothetical protein
MFEQIDHGLKAFCKMARLCAGLKGLLHRVCGGRTMGVKKAKGKVKSAAKESAKKSETKKGKDIVEVRVNIDNLVKESAEKIAAEVIKVALTGQLATAKYLFEAVGLYPATEQTMARPIETSLAHTLLTRMGLPLEPVVCDEESAPAAKSEASGAETGLTIVPKEDPGEKPEDEEEESLADEGEERETVQ